MGCTTPACFPAMRRLRPRGRRSGAGPGRRAGHFRVPVSGAWCACSSPVCCLFLACSSTCSAACCADDSFPARGSVDEPRAAPGAGRGRSGVKTLSPRRCRSSTVFHACFRACDACSSPVTLPVTLPAGCQLSGWCRRASAPGYPPWMLTAAQLWMLSGDPRAGSGDRRNASALRQWLRRGSSPAVGSLAFVAAM
jgi:hypothetical protein